MSKLSTVAVAVMVIAACHGAPQSRSPDAQAVGLQLPGGVWVGGRPDPDPPDKAALRVRLREAIATGGATEARFRAAAAAYHGRFDEAAVLLDHAGSLGLPPADVAADQAAVALASAVTGAEPLGRVVALDRAETAAGLDPRNPSPLLTRALVLQGLHLTSAVQARERFTEVASASPGWADLAAAATPRSRDLDDECWRDPERWTDWLAHPTLHPEPELTPHRNVQDLRMFIEDRLLPAWAESVVAGNAARRRSLEAVARRLVRSLREEAGAGLTQLVVEQFLARPIVAAPSLMTYGDGRATFRSLDYDSCAETLEQAERQLDALGSPLALRARGYRAACLARIGDEEGSVEIARGLMDSTFPLIRAQAATLLGMSLSRKGQPEEALPMLSSAADLARSKQELAMLAVVEVAIADALFLVGELEKAWQHYEEALRTAAKSCNRYARNTTIWLGSELLYRSGATRASTTFLRESVALEEAEGSPLLMLETLSTLALTEANTRRDDRALATVTRARALAEKVDHGSVREVQMALLDWAEATALRDHAPSRAARLLERAATPLAKAGRRSQHTLAVLDLGRSLLLSGDRRRGREELERGIAAYEDLRDRVGAYRDPARAFAAAEPAFDALTRTLLEEGRAEDALANAERGRRWRSPKATATDFASARRSVDARTGVLYLDQMDDQLAAWWMTDGVLRSWTIPSSREETRRAISRQHFEKTHAPGIWGELTRPLFAPIDGDFATIRRLVVVAEDALAVLPWAWLAAETGSRVGNGRTVTVAPSLSVAAGNLPRNPPQRTLVVADATTSAHLRLPSLAAARDAAERIAELYPQATTLVETAATRSEVLRNWADVDVLHFGVHALGDRTFPGAARLALADLGEGSAFLTVDDIASVRFARSPVVILSACATRDGDVVALAGPMDLARAFLRAGASGVVATLTPVDDRLAADVMLRFHRSFSATGDAASALSEATRGLVGSAARGSHAFQYVGADSALSTPRSSRPREPLPAALQRTVRGG